MQSEKEIMDSRLPIVRVREFKVPNTTPENESSLPSCMATTGLPDSELISYDNLDKPFHQGYGYSSLCKATEIPQICDSKHATQNTDKDSITTLSLKDRECSNAKTQIGAATRKSSEPALGIKQTPVLHETKSDQFNLGKPSEPRIYYITDGLVKCEGDDGVVIVEKRTKSSTIGYKTDNNNTDLLCGDNNELPSHGYMSDQAKIVQRSKEELRCEREGEPSPSGSNTLQSIVVHFLEEKRGENPLVIPCESDISDDLIDLGQKKSPFKRLQPPLDAHPAKSCLRTPSHSFKIFQTGKDPLKTKSENQNAAEVELVAILLEHRDSCRSRRLVIRKRRPDLLQDEINIPDILARAARPKSQKILRSLTTPFRRVRSLLTGCLRPKAL